MNGVQVFDASPQVAEHLVHLSSYSQSTAEEQLLHYQTCKHRFLYLTHTCIKLLFSGLYIPLHSEQLLSNSTRCILQLTSPIPGSMMTSLVLLRIGVAKVQSHAPQLVHSFGTHSFVAVGLSVYNYTESMM